MRIRDEGCWSDRPPARPHLGPHQGPAGLPGGAQPGHLPRELYEGGIGPVHGPADDGGAAAENRNREDGLEVEILQAAAELTEEDLQPVEDDSERPEEEEVPEQEAEREEQQADANAELEEDEGENAEETKA